MEVTGSVYKDKRIRVDIKMDKGKIISVTRTKDSDGHEQLAIQVHDDMALYLTNESAEVAKKTGANRVGLGGAFHRVSNAITDSLREVLEESLD